MAYDEDDGDDDAMMRMLMICFVLISGCMTTCIGQRLFCNVSKMMMMMMMMMIDHDDGDKTIRIKLIITSLNSIFISLMTDEINDQDNVMSR